MASVCFMFITPPHYTRYTHIFQPNVSTTVELVRHWTCGVPTFPSCLWQYVAGNQTRPSLRMLLHNLFIYLSKDWTILYLQAHVLCIVASACSSFSYNIHWHIFMFKPLQVKHSLSFGLLHCYCWIHKLFIPVSIFHLYQEESMKCSWNDCSLCTKGTAGVAIAGLLGAVRAQGRPMIDFPKQRIVVAGAGRSETLSILFHLVISIKLEYTHAKWFVATSVVIVLIITYELTYSVHKES